MVIYNGSLFVWADFFLSVFSSTFRNSPRVSPANSSRGFLGFAPSVPVEIFPVLLTRQWKLLLEFLQEVLVEFSQNFFMGCLQEQFQGLLPEAHATRVYRRINSGETSTIFPNIYYQPNFLGWHPNSFFLRRGFLRCFRWCFSMDFFPSKTFTPRKFSKMARFF